MVKLQHAFRMMSDPFFEAYMHVTEVVLLPLDCCNDFNYQDFLKFVFDNAVETY